MSFDTLLLHHTHDAVVTVTLNRPKVLHALNAQLFNDLESVFTQLRDDPHVRVILLTGAGDRAFAAGADIAELARTDAASANRLALRGQSILRLIETCTKPVIALVNGFALGGGCELALACTFRIASDTARLGQPEVKLGLLPGYGGTQRLPRLVGRGAALKLLLTGEPISAAEALRIGLVDEVVPPAELLPRGHALAQSILANAPLAIAACLDAVERGAGLPLEQALMLEAQLFSQLSGTQDKKEGTSAFLEKRPPVWSGR
jgi:enoyl-CoA hydratase